MLLIKDGLILSVSLKKDHTKFGLPGGKVEDTDKSPLDSAIRECFEETGVSVSEAIYLYKREEPPLTSEGSWFNTYCYVAIDWSGTPFSAEEGVVKWLTAADLTGPSGAYANYNKQTFEQFRRLFPDIELK